MATIRVPTLGESVSIAVDEPLVELETDKVTVEVPAPAAGVLAEITAKEGDTVEVGALLGQISSDGAAVAAAPAQKKEEAKPAAAAPAAAPVASASSGPAMQPAPAAAKLLAESGLSADQVEGSGKRGQVAQRGHSSRPSRKAVSAAPAAPVAARPASSADDASREERVKMTRLRQTIAARLKDAQNTAAMLTTFNEVDMSAVMELRNKYKDRLEKKHGVKLGFMGFFTKAVTHALKEIPAVNAEIDGTDIVYKNFCHVGMAVGTDKGLVVPVIRDADQMSIAEVEKELARLARAARDGSLSMADMQGGTFTITNGGVYSLMSRDLCASRTLGMYKIQECPMVVGGQIVVRPMMYLALSYDHRIVDGKEAVTFLVRAKESLEDPEHLVLDL
uniref:Dihydrolipoyllysine-residue succinyltransferase n=1 Tax=Brucella abortus TaxID=235 RepID=O85598_BRUAO|nr:dihydrolipoamide succinyl transferase [Brucella abortus]